MTDTLCQRWRERRADYRPAGEPIATADYEVAEVPQDAIAKAFVVQHHYSATYPAARFRFGLYRHAELVGVAVFSHPCSDAVLTSVFPGEAKASVELGRFVLLDDVPSNGETWFLARCFAQLRQTGLRGVVSFSDPVPRRASTGALVMPGHVGTIYQAANAVYLGRATPRSLRLFRRRNRLLRPRRPEDSTAGSRLALRHRPARGGRSARACSCNRPHRVASRHRAPKLHDNPAAPW